MFVQHLLVSVGMFTRVYLMNPYDTFWLYGISVLMASHDILPQHLLRKAQAMLCEVVGVARMPRLAVSATRIRLRAAPRSLAWVRPASSHCFGPLL